MTLAPESGVVLRVGVNVDLGRRYYGVRRIRATYPIGRLKITEGKASLRVTRFGALPRNLPLPLDLSPATTCVYVRHGWPPGVGFKTTDTVHQVWSLHPGRIVATLQEVGFQICS